MDHGPIGITGTFSGDGSYTILGHAVAIVENTTNEGLVDNEYIVIIPGGVMTWWAPVPKGPRKNNFT
jgi:hypothetical protein